jgi:hypothetical protein
VSDDRTRRVGLNESIFRQVNEQIRSLDHDAGTGERTMAVVCECGNANCAAQIEVPVAEYERARSDSLLYVVVPGHVIPDVEEVVERAGGYAVVRKVDGAAARVAEETDPRS